MLGLETRGPSALLLPTPDPFSHGPAGTIAPQASEKSDGVIHSKLDRARGALTSMCWPRTTPLILIY